METECRCLMQRSNQDSSRPLANQLSHLPVKSVTLDPSQWPPCCCSGQLRVFWRERERLQQLRPQFPLCSCGRGGGCLLGLLLYSHHQGGGGGGWGSHSWRLSSRTQFCRCVARRTAAVRITCRQATVSSWRDLQWPGEGNQDAEAISALRNAK